MKIYPHLFAYLNQLDPIEPNTHLHSKNRPIISTASAEFFISDQLLRYKGTRNINHVLDVDKVSEAVYEIAAPYLDPNLVTPGSSDPFCTLKLSVESENNSKIQNYQLHINDEVIDEAKIETEEQLHLLQTASWSYRLDQKVAELILILTGFIENERLLKKTQIADAEIRVLEIEEFLQGFDSREAALPLLVSLEKRYQISHKLTQITTKLRYQLRRQAELMPVGRIQEMDSYCLRDYIRRPGRTPEEKSGSRQELMGIQRYQDFGTYENRFLVHFSKILHLECIRHEKNQEYSKPISRISKTLMRFKQEPSVQGIPSQHFRLGTPNYVLQQNPIYNGFYQAYLDYIKQRFQKEKIWSFRGQLLTDVIQLCLTSTLLSFQGAFTSPVAHYRSRKTSDQGHYLHTDPIQTICVYLKQQVYEFELSKCLEFTNGDISLLVRIHDLGSPLLEVHERLFPLWLFWYKPSFEVMKQASIYLENINRIGVIIYLQNPPQDSEPTNNSEYQGTYCFDHHLQILQLPDLDQINSFTYWVQSLASLLRGILLSKKEGS